MDRIVINGGNRLCGRVEISGMKNSALPIIFASLLVPEECIIHNVPRVSDVYNALELLRSMGAKAEFCGEKTVVINTENAKEEVGSLELVSKMRASSYLMGAMLARFGKVEIPLPGGCNFGARPLDLHFKGFEELGADCFVDEEKIAIFSRNKLKSKKIRLDKISVGATINMILASVLTEGKTVIHNTAREPHVDDLICFLNKCGADIRRSGCSVFVNGASSLRGVRYRIYPDMIEALTYISCVGASGGAVELKNINVRHLWDIIPLFEYMGMDIQCVNGSLLNVRSSIKLCGAHVKTKPYPGFPTDFHPQFSSLLCLTKGGGSVEESIFPGRFAYVSELEKMGGRVDKTDNKVFIYPSDLIGAETDATDLRAGAALIVASLGANGESSISNIGYILRGYEDIVGKLSSLGAIIKIV